MQPSTVLKPPPFHRNHLLRDASYQALYDVMARDSSVHLFGEGAHVKVHYDAPQIKAKFSDRVHTLPISEDGNTNYAIGTSLLGVKPVIDVISSDFLYRTFDSICNTAAKLNFMRPSEPPRTIVIRAEFFTGGPTTGQRLESLFVHIPGLRVVIPSTPRDAYGLMKTALETPGVTVYFEDRMIADDAEWDTEDLILGEPVPFGSLFWRIMGKKPAGGTILTYGIMRQRVERIVKTWRSKWSGDLFDLPNLNVDVIDLRSLYPIDWDYLLSMHVLRTSRVLIIEPDIVYGGIGAEIVAHIAERRHGIDFKRLGARRITTPASSELHQFIMPTDEEITQAITEFTN